LSFGLANSHVVIASSLQFEETTLNGIMELHSKKGNVIRILFPFKEYRSPDLF
jgi:hypothetical protein